MAQQLFWQQPRKIPLNLVCLLLLQVGELKQELSGSRNRVALLREELNWAKEELTSATSLMSMLRGEVQSLLGKVGGGAGVGNVCLPVCQ